MQDTRTHVVHAYSKCHIESKMNGTFYYEIPFFRRELSNSLLYRKFSFYF